LVAGHIVASGNFNTKSKRLISRASRKHSAGPTDRAGKQARVSVSFGIADFTAHVSGIFLIEDFLLSDHV
jgi:hypothetical protein